MNGSFLGIIGVTLPVFLLLGLGVFLRKSSLLPAEAESPLMRVIVTVFYPALILNAVGPTPVVGDVGLVAVSIATGFLTILLGFGLAWLLAPAFRLKMGEGRRAFSFTTGIYNYGYLPVPLVLAFYGQQDGTLAILFVHNVGVDLAFWTVGVLILQGIFNRDGFRRIINPPLIALVVALVLNYSGIYAILPGFVERFIEYLAAISVPLGIILAGCAIGG
ncbi:MAG: AEC family transporter, partial [Puniceicoccales bacterium]